MSTFGLNILPQLQEGTAHLDSTMLRLKATTLLVQDEIGRAIDLKARGYDVVWRAVYDEDADYRQSPAGFWARHEAAAKAGLIIQVLNEPVTLTKPDDADYCTFMTGVMAARPPGARVMVFNFGVGRPHEGRIAAGEYDPILQAMLPGDVIGCHEYFMSADNLADQIPWHVGRFRFWLGRFRQLRPNDPLPRVIISEFGYDRGGGAGDGWSGNISQEQYAELIHRAGAIYRDNNVHACVFGWGDGYSWQSFNIERAEAVIGALVEENAKAPTAPPPVVPAPPLPDWGAYRTAKITAIKGGAPWVNIRAETSAASKDLGDIRVGNIVELSERVYDANGFTWHRVRLPTLEGFVANFFTYEAVVIPPPLPGVPVFFVHFPPLALEGVNERDELAGWIANLYKLLNDVDADRHSIVCAWLMSAWLAVLGAKLKTQEIPAVTDTQEAA